MRSVGTFCKQNETGHVHAGEGNAAEAPIDPLELAGVQAAADVESKGLDLPNDRRSGP